MLTHLLLHAFAYSPVSLRYACQSFLYGGSTWQPSQPLFCIVVKFRPALQTAGPSLPKCLHRTGAAPPKKLPKKKKKKKNSSEGDRVIVCNRVASAQRWQQEPGWRRTSGVWRKNKESALYGESHTFFSFFYEGKTQIMHFDVDVE